MNSREHILHRRRLRAETRFRRYGQAALACAVMLLFILLASLCTRGYSGFMQTQIALPVTFNASVLGVKADATASDLSTVMPSTFNALAQTALLEQFPQATKDGVRNELFALISAAAGSQLRCQLLADPALLGTKRLAWLPAASAVDLAYKRHDYANLSKYQRQWLQQLKIQQHLRAAFNTTFFRRGDSRLPEHAGFLGAIMGSLLTLGICLMVVLPLGVMTAVYLEEFARKSWWVTALEININNLAAVPSILFGLLGVAVYINFFNLPRSVPVVGGLTLALMVLPVIIITTRIAIKAVPGSIRDAALALGASPLRIVWDHTLPLALPGMMTGVILSMARAIGETAPLLMIGMVAFVADVPDGFSTSATVMPVQIYLWASSAESGFAEKTAAGILVLLVLLLAMNALAIVLRKRFEVRW